MIVPGGGISLDGENWVSCRPGFFLPVRVLSRLFRRLFLEKLVAAHQAGELQFFGNHAALTDAKAFAAYLAPLRNSEWVVYSKRPFGGPKEVLRYLARYTHRVAISNRRLIALDDNGVTFKWKDYRIEGRERYKVMTLAINEFIRRFLMHVLPQGFHRIRYYGLLASTTRADNIARARELLAVPMLPIDAIKAASTKADEPQTPEHPCPCCGGRMIIIETFERGCSPQYRPTARTRNQDRYLMTSAPKPRRRKAACLLRWFQPATMALARASHQRCVSVATSDRRSDYAPRMRNPCRLQSPQPAPSFALLAPDLSIRRAQIPIAPAARRLLSRGFLPWRFSYAGPRCAWRRRHGAGIRKPSHEPDIAQHYSITSSARASSVGGTSRPSALAVLRLMTSSNLVGACTGRSAGFSPLRMRST